MSSLLMILLLTLLQFFTGFGLINLFRIQLKPAMLISLSILLGIAVFSVMPFVLQLFFVPLTSYAIFSSLLLACILVNLGYKRTFQLLKTLFRESRFRIKLYEIPFLLVISFIVLISVWRCFYLPPTPRDLTSGAEVIAEYAVKEKTMINSVFSVNLESTNNQFKPPFITSLQIIYKYAGFPFAQIWLSTIVICFIVFLYHALSQKIHSMLAGLLIIFFLAIPEMYAYTFMVLFDYNNAVFFFLSSYFLFEYFRNGQRNYIAFAGLLMGIATYTRSETLVLACLMSLVIMWHHIKKWDSLTNLLISCIYFLAPAVLFYLVSVTIYINFYLPVPYNVEGLVNSNLLNPLPLFQRFAAMNEELIFSWQGVIYYGYFIFIFLLLLLNDIVFSEKLNSTSRNWLFAVLVIYWGYPILGYLLPLLDIDHSTKRGLFKIFPLMLLYMGSSSLLIDLSARLTKWEEKK